MAESLTSLLRYRVVNRITGTELTSDLPHLHRSTWDIPGMQPGNPASSAVGTFTIPLHPPSSEAFAAAKPIYDQLFRYLRVEAYISPDGVSPGRLYQAGPITGIRKKWNTYELTGLTDLAWALYSRPFPGELLSNDVTSAMLKSYLGTNELGWTDNFSPYTAGNYNSTTWGGGASGSWSGTTDDGFNVVSCASGSGAALVAASGAVAPNDRWRTRIVEISGRLKPSASATNAGTVGVGMSIANNATSTSVEGHITAKLLNGRYVLDCALDVFAAGVPSSQVKFNELTDVDDPDGYIRFTITLLVTRGGNAGATATASLTVNGKIVAGQFPAGFDLTVTTYPFVAFGAPSSGTATCYVSNLVQMNRFVADGASSAAAFGLGSISASTHSLGYLRDVGPSFLDAWSRFATREGWYWRYTPQPFVAGTRTLGLVDFAADPGTDRGTDKRVVFSKADGSLIDLEFTDNADPLSSDTAVVGQSTPDGGGLAFFRDIASMTKYGVVQDEVLAFVHPDFNSLSRAAFQINANKIAVDQAGAVIATVRRDPRTADVSRELDKAMFDWPEMGVNQLVARIVRYQFTEGEESQILTLNQFSSEE